MKLEDIAKKKHITIEELTDICKELGIACTSEVSELEDQEVFLLEKKIDVDKQKKAEELVKNKKSKKIKLKRKVVLPKDKKEKADEEKRLETAEKNEGKVKEVKTEASVPLPEKKEKVDSHPPQNARGQSNVRHTSKPFVKFEKSERITPVEKPDILQKTDPGKKRKKVKEKPVELKGKSKKFQEEKNFEFQKRKDVASQKKEIVTPEIISITESISVGDLAKKLNIKANEIIFKLMKLGVMATITQTIDHETVEILAAEYNTKVKLISLYEDTVIKTNELNRIEDEQPRPPVVTVMGHVDHGKTKLLDAIRQTDVTASEHGGITQHIGAYKVRYQDKAITFLDTPGHASFSAMRARGAKITDIVILVVAANDGVMPQTIEAINHAKAAEVPIIVAINKIDLQDADPRKVRNELLNHELIPEELGGTTLFAEISAKEKININGLLDLVLLQAEMLELSANSTINCRGTVVESKLDYGRGAVSTVLVQNGTLKVGDPFVVGIYSGKVRAMFDDKGEPVDIAGPSTPVEVLGISGVPTAGDPFEGVESDKFAKQISQKRHEYMRIETAKKVKKVTLESLNDMLREGEIKDLNIIVKADVDGSGQALKGALEDLSTDDIRVKVIHTATGGINESDVMLAAASNALIIGFHVRPSSKVSEIAEKESVSIKFYNVIFKATDDIKAAMIGMLEPEFIEEITGSGEVRQIFKISKIGVIAGSLLLSGIVDKSSSVRLLRDGIVVHDGSLKSLKRFKDDVNSVAAGQEFGFGYENFIDIKEGDTFEAYKINKVKKTL